jgi:GxxExxY protein
MNELTLDELTQKVIGAAYTVSNTLGIGFVEKVYENAHALEMRKSGLKVTQQYPIKVGYDNVIVGEFFADMLIDERVLIELKAVRELDKNHLAQALNYLRATDFETCLLINFGKTRIDVRRLHRSPRWKK